MNISKKNLDIFNVEKEFNIKYPHEKLNEVLKKYRNRC